MTVDALDILAGAEELDTALLAWARRNDTKAQPEVRQAGSAAVAAVDGLLRDLQTIRRRLITEIHASDTASAARADALLDRPPTD